MSEAVSPTWDRRDSHSLTWLAVGGFDLGHLGDRNAYFSNKLNDFDFIKKSHYKMKK